MIPVQWILHLAHVARTNYPFRTAPGRCRERLVSGGKSNCTNTIFRLQVVKTAKIRQFFGFSRQSLNLAAGKSGFSCVQHLPRDQRCWLTVLSEINPAGADASKSATVAAGNAAGTSSHFPMQKWLKMWSRRSSVYTSPRTICSSRRV